MKRPHLLIMEKIRTKLENMLKSKIGEEYGKNILMALKDKTIEKDIKNLMKGDKIQIHNEQNEPVYKKIIVQAAVEDVNATPTSNGSNDRPFPLKKKVTGIDVEKIKKD